MTSDPRTRSGFEELLPAVRGGLPEQALKVLKGVEEVLGLAHELDAALKALVHPSAVQALRDITAQREGLVHKGFVTEIGAARLGDTARYLKGALVRLEKLPRDAERDKGLLAGVHEVEAEWVRLPEGPGKEQVRWMIQELRISLFAQTLKAKGPVSIQRVFRAIDDLLA